MQIGYNFRDCDFIFIVFKKIFINLDKGNYIIDEDL